MTDIKMLPLPSDLLNWPHPTNHVAIRDYARAVAEHNVAARDAEIETLRAEMEVWKASFEQAAAGHATYAERVERLAEAIKAYKSECDNPAKDYVLRAKRRDEMFALLRDHDQEVGNG